MIIKCFINNIPLPAIETLNNKKELTRQYCIFYNHFLCGGLQKKEYLKKVIMQKHSENKLRFGTCSFEAHVHNIIEQNYFVWIYDVLTDPVLDVGNQSLLTFQTEYDNHVTIDDKTNSVCNLYMPKEIEIMYSEQKDDYILLNRNDEDEAIRAESSINDQIKLVNEKLAQVQKSNTRIEKLELLKYELSKYATERRDTQNTEENGIA